MRKSPSMQKVALRSSGQKQMGGNRSPDTRSSSTSHIIKQFGKVTQKAGHKDYLGNMLVSRLQKKFPQATTDPNV